MSDHTLQGADKAPERGPMQLADPGWNEATWVGETPEAAPAKSPLDGVRGALRLLAFAAVTAGLLPVFFIARALGGRRDRRIAALWCGISLRLCGLSLKQIGAPMGQGGAILANHGSWIDILAIGAAAPVHFVAKAEVAGWPLFGWIGKISNTVFIERRRTEAKAQERHLAERARGGDLLCIFPEGTSTDGLRVLPFKSSIFAMFFADRAQPPFGAQAVTVHYAPGAPGLAVNFYGWWGKMGLFGHLWNVVCLSRQGVATVIFHPPLDVASFDDRKALAAEAQAQVSAGMAEAMRTTAPRA